MRSSPSALSREARIMRNHKESLRNLKISVETYSTKSTLAVTQICFTLRVPNFCDF
nr:MAG TPA: hypothetical protein [Caudoviricetes sp.]